MYRVIGVNAAAKVLLDRPAGVTFVFVWYEGIFRWLSHFWPIRIARAESAMGTVEISWENGHKVLNSSNGNQSFGSLHEVWVQSFEAVGLKERPIGNALLLGLGAGSAIHIIRHDLRLRIPITVIEMDPAMVRIANEHFGLGDHRDVELMQGDAIVQVHALKERFDLVIVDLFNDLDMAMGVDTSGFAHGLRDRCAEGGMVLFNTVEYDRHSSARCDRVLSNLKKVFSSVKEFKFEGVNRVFVAQ